MNTSYQSYLIDSLVFAIHKEQWLITHSSHCKHWENHTRSKSDITLLIIPWIQKTMTSPYQSKACDADSSSFVYVRAQKVCCMMVLIRTRGRCPSHIKPCPDALQMTILETTDMKEAACKEKLISGTMLLLLKKEWRKEPIEGTAIIILFTKWTSHLTLRTTNVDSELSRLAWRWGTLLYCSWRKWRPFGFQVSTKNSTNAFQICIESSIFLESSQRLDETEATILLSLVRSSATLSRTEQDTLQKVHEAEHESHHSTRKWGYANCPRCLQSYSCTNVHELQTLNSANTSHLDAPADHYSQKWGPPLFNRLSHAHDQTWLVICLLVAWSHQQAAQSRLSCGKGLSSAM